MLPDFEKALKNVFLAHGFDIDMKIGTASFFPEQVSFNVKAVLSDALGISSKNYNKFAAEHNLVAHGEYIEFPYRKRVFLVTPQEMLRGNKSVIVVAQDGEKYKIPVGLFLTMGRKELKVDNVMSAKTLKAIDQRMQGVRTQLAMMEPAVQPAESSTAPTAAAIEMDF